MRRKRREELAPSLFPFLAVLLCTMGALVLILMLVVGQAQATANEAITAKQEKQEDIAAQLKLLKESLADQREKLQLELEKKRLSLQAFEEQIRQSIQEMVELDRTLELIESQSSQSDRQVEEINLQLSQLEKQLAEAAEKMKPQLEKPTGDKPVFAIIPYDGPNGTHRRPVYLECVADGIIIQPEGVKVGLADLRPPYGPGNPLDAVLRTVRSKYVPANGALTSTAYPLLVVRPSGVQTYAMARMAMAGWDDQFGYELVEEQLDLVYPEGEPGLRNEIEKSLALARTRQAALVMAMPGKFRNYVEEFGSDEYHPLSGGSFGASQAANDHGLASRSGDREGSGDSGTGSRGGLAGTRGGFNLVSEVGSGLPDNIVDAAEPATSSSPFMGSSSGSSFLGSTNAAGETDLPGQATRPNQDEFANGQTELNGQGDAGGTSSGSELASAAANGDPQGISSSDGKATQLSKTKTARTQPTRQNQGSSSAAGAGPGPMVRPGAAEVPVPSSIAGNPSSEVTMDAQGPTGLSFNLNRNSAEPVARKKGRNWAWSGKSGAGTPVVRSIKMQCYADRWILLPDTKSGTIAEIIMLDAPPQACAERLARIVADRVEGWGLALMGGYWKPELVVDVASGAEQTFVQLQRLLEGSGLEVQRTK